MKNRKIIFLDIDGVLNTTEKYAFKECLIFDSIFRIEKEKLARLKQIIEDTGAEIVLSSSWRNMGEDLFEWLSSILPIIDKTDRYFNIPDDYHSRANPKAKSFRGREIHHWILNRLMTDGEVISDWVIVDDDGDMLEHQLKRFVQTDPGYGLTDTLAFRIKSILNHGDRYTGNYEKGFFE